jgi:2-polyprenyl-3-methyl-5-hydroxy-6-metoxy-1,4-benzoquinol methylase
MNYFFIKLRFYTYKFYRVILDFRTSIKLNPFSKVIHSSINAYNDKTSNKFKLISTNIEGKYFWKEVPFDFEYCKTSEHLGVREISLIQFYTIDNKKYMELCKPEGHSVIYMKFLLPKYFLDSYYKGDYDSEALELSENPELLKSKRSSNKVEHFCKSFLKDKSKILDIGCGFGDQLSHFHDKGHVTLGIEPGKKRAEFAEKVFGLDIINLDLESISDSKKLSNKKFNLIYMNHVFEHLANPITLLTSLIEFLDDDGKIFIAIPNFSFEGVLIKMLSPVHTHSFTSVGLVSIASKIGLKLFKNFSNDQYNIMIFEKGNIINNHNDGVDIQTDIQDFFGLNKNIKSGDFVFVHSNLLGSWSSLLKCVSLNEFNKFPIIINTDFPAPRFLLK